MRAYILILETKEEDQDIITVGYELAPLLQAQVRIITLRELPEKGKCTVELKSYISYCGRLWENGKSCGISGWVLEEMKNTQASEIDLKYVSPELVCPLEAPGWLFVEPASINLNYY